MGKKEKEKAYTCIPQFYYIKVGQSGGIYNKEMYFLMEGFIVSNDRCLICFRLDNNIHIKHI